MTQVDSDANLLPKLPIAREFILNTHLYAVLEFAEKDTWDALSIVYFNGTYDSYCIGCKKDSTFQVASPARPTDHLQHITVRTGTGTLLRANSIPKVNDIFRIHAKCTRSDSHSHDFFANVSRIYSIKEGKSSARLFIQKIGQQPSFTDLHLSDNKKYAKVLSQSQMGDLTRAISLASHDIGVGSYVYLRRIFEALVEEAHCAAQKDNAWDDELYLRSRMNEKISLLREHLPAFLVEHPAMYSLLSKGIHELSEEDCLKHFGTLKVGIELILDEKLEQKEKADKIKQAKAALAKAFGDTSPEKVG